MQTVNYSDYIYYAGTTQPVVRVPVYVYEANTENLASLYDGSGAAIDNPTKTDDNGLFDFWTTFGKYDIYVHNTKEYSVSLLNLAYFYLGIYDANPTERPDGSALQDGDMYFNSVINHTKLYNNGLWYYADDMMNASGVAYDPASGPQTDVQTQMRDYDAHLSDIDDQFDTLYSESGSDEIGFIQDGVDAVATTVQTKLRETVSVKDFGAVGDGVTDDTAAIQAAIAASNAVFLPEGTYLVSEAIQLRAGQILTGDGPYVSILKRTNTTPETIDGLTITSVVYVYGSHNSISNIGITAKTTSVSGLFMNCNNSVFTNIRIANTKHGVDSSLSQTWMCSFRNVHVIAASTTAFDFSGTGFKTSLTFDSCWAENVGNAWYFNRAQYCTLNSCGADWANYTSTGNPYGTGYGSRASAYGVYHFAESCRVVMNGCGCENSYGNGLVSFGGGSNQLTINNMHSATIKSEFVPDYANYPNWAVGPIQFGQGVNSLVINGISFDFTNTVVPVSYPTKPVATLVAFNYSEAAYGAKTTKMVFVSAGFEGTGTVFAGQGNSTKYCTLLWNEYYNPIITGTQTQDLKISKQITLSGSGTVISIPFVSQSSQNRKHSLRVIGIDNTVNGTSSKAFSANAGCASLTSVVNVTSGNLFNVTSVTASGLNLQITVPSSLTNPILYVEAISERLSLIDLDNISIA